MDDLQLSCCDWKNGRVQTSGCQRHCHPDCYDCKIIEKIKFKTFWISQTDKAIEGFKHLKRIKL